MNTVLKQKLATTIYKHYQNKLHMYYVRRRIWIAAMTNVDVRWWTATAHIHTGITNYTSPVDSKQVKPNTLSVILLFKLVLFRFILKFQVCCLLIKFLFKFLVQLLAYCLMFLFLCKCYMIYYLLYFAH